MTRGRIGAWRDDVRDGFFWIAIVALIAFAARSGRTSTTGDGHQVAGAREILEERFARGEISEEEFEGRKQVLAWHAQ